MTASPIYVEFHSNQEGWKTTTKFKALMWKHKFIETRKKFSAYHFALVHDKVCKFKQKIEILKKTFVQ